MALGTFEEDLEPTSSTEGAKERDAKAEGGGEDGALAAEAVELGLVIEAEGLGERREERAGRMGRPEGRTTIEAAPVQGKGSNGEVERGQFKRSQEL